MSIVDKREIHKGKLTWRCGRFFGQAVKIYPQYTHFFVILENRNGYPLLNLQKTPFQSQLFIDVFHNFSYAGVFLHEHLDFFQRVQNGSVVLLAEVLGDLLQTGFGVSSAHVHSHLTG